MSLVTKLKRRFFRAIIKLDRRSAFYAMRSVYMDGMVRRLNDSSQFHWDQFKIEKTPKKFEDLAGLFFCSPLSRGILRQDIDEAALLFKQISKMDAPRGVEIGRFYGGSTVLLCTAIGERGKLLSIDIAPKHQDAELKEVLERLQLTSRVELMIADANKVEMSDSLDFAFIDGDHSYEGARLDHNKWGAKLKVGGLLIHHDMGHSRKHSVQWNELFLLYQNILQIQQPCLEVLAEAGSMVVFRKTNVNWINLPPNNSRGLNTEGKQTKSNSYLNKEQ